MLAEMINLTNNIKTKLVKSRIIKPQFVCNIYDTLPFCRYDHSQVEYNKDYVFICGGKDENGNVVDTTFLYDFKDKKIIYLRNLPKPLYAHYAIKAQDGYVYIFGGYDDTGADNPTIYRYEPKYDTYDIVGQLSEPCGYLSCAQLLDNKIFISVGYSNSNAAITSNIYLFDINTGSISILSTSGLSYFSYYAGDFVSMKNNSFAVGFPGINANSGANMVIIYPNGGYGVSYWSSNRFAYHKHSTILDKYLLTIGGKNYISGVISNSIFLTDTDISFNETPASETSSTKLPYPILRFSMSKVNNTESLLIFGGLDDSSTPRNNMIYIEIKL